MNTQKTLFYTLIILFIGVANVQAQQGVFSSGGDASSGDGSVSFTIGQVITEYSQDTFSSVSSGVQQAYEFSMPVDVDDQPHMSLTASAYPNPTIDNLTLSIDGFTNEVYTYTITDALGRQLNNGRINQSSTSVPMDQYAQGTYMVNVLSNKQTLKTFIVLKK